MLIKLLRGNAIELCTTPIFAQNWSEYSFGQMYLQPIRLIAVAVDWQVSSVLSKKLHLSVKLMGLTQNACLYDHELILVFFFVG